MSKNTIAVVGLGYVGLPLSILAAEKGYQVTGIDLDKKKVDLLNKDESPIQDVSSDEIRKNKNFIASSEITNIKNTDIQIICVPTPVDHGRTPDLKPLKRAVKTAAGVMPKKSLLIIESTINPSVCDDVVIPIAEKESGLKVNIDFFVAHCPERINPGDFKWNVRNINRVVGGSNREALDRAVEFYEDIIEAKIKPMDSLKEAEAVKVVENSFRDINIAFVNELAMSFQRMGINVDNVIDGASTKPFGYMPFRPGSGVGGHCIPVDPYYLIEYAKGYDFSHDFLSLARKINEQMPQFAVGLLQDELDEAGLIMSGSEIALLGLSYKSGVDDDRESPSYVISDLLLEKGANVRLFDPYIPNKSSVKSIEEALNGADAVFIATPHKKFDKELSPESLKKRNIKAILDGKNGYRQYKQQYEAKNIIYRGIGI